MASQPVFLPGSNVICSSPSLIVPNVGISSRLTQRQKRALAAAGRADERRHRTFGDPHADVLQDDIVAEPFFRYGSARSCARLQEAAIAGEAFFQPHLQRGKNRA